jgi:hypothetical protein
LPLKTDLNKELFEHHFLLQSLLEMSGHSTCSDVLTRQRTMEHIEFIKRELAARNDLMHQMSREREDFRQKLALIGGELMNGEQTSSEPSSFSSKRLSQQSLYSEMPLPAMSTSKSVSVASCFQAIPAVTVPTCASMSVSLGVPVDTVNASGQIGGVTCAGHVRNGTCIGVQLFVKMVWSRYENLFPPGSSCRNASCSPAPSEPADSTLKDSSQERLLDLDFLPKTFSLINL